MTETETADRHNRESAYYYAANRAHSAEMMPDRETDAARAPAIREHLDAARLTDNAAQRKYHLDRVAFWEGHTCHALTNFDMGFASANCGCGWGGPERGSLFDAQADRDAHLAEAMAEEAHRMRLHSRNAVGRVRILPVLVREGMERTCCGRSRRSMEVAGS